jgi:hypothetical protein
LVNIRKSQYADNNLTKDFTIAIKEVCEPGPKNIEKSQRDKEKIINFLEDQVRDIKKDKELL